MTATVVIATFNNISTLPIALTSLSRQTIPAGDIEVIVSDDGSSDDTADQVKQYADAFGAFEYITQPDEGYRLASARNNGIERASGDVIIILDADVVPSPTLVSAHCSTVLADQPTASIGYFKYIYLPVVRPDEIAADLELIAQAEDYPSPSNRGFIGDRRLPEFADFDHHPMPFNCFHGGNHAFRAADARAIGMFDTRFDGHWGYEDIQFGFRLWRAGVTLVPSPDALGYHCDTPAKPASPIAFDGWDGPNYDLICREIPDYRDFRGTLLR